MSLYRTNCCFVQSGYAFTTTLHVDVAGKIVTIIGVTTKGVTIIGVSNIGVTTIGGM